MDPTFVTGGTGYLGRGLIEELVSRGGDVRVLVRPGSERRVPPGARDAAHIAARTEGEAAVRASGIPATILRAWYVLGPGHCRPYVLVPVYGILRRMARTRDGAERPGLVTRRQMVNALVRAVEEGSPSAIRIVGVPDIRRAG